MAFWHKPIQYRWQWQLKSSPEALWPYVADTQRFNQATKLPAITYTENPLDIGASQRIGQTSKFGIGITFEDFPFDWVKEEGFRNVREFSKGPVRRTFAELKLEPNDAGTLLHYNVDVEAANIIGWLGTPYQFGWEMRRNFESVFRQADAAIQGQAAQPFTLKVTPLSAAATRRVQQFQQQLVANGHERAWVTRLTDLITQEADFNLLRIQPYALATQWQAPKKAILELCLSAAKFGLLIMQWDLLCPLCRGDKVKAASLDELQQGVHCDTCNIDYDVDFAQNVELTFMPHPQIRPIQNNAYCIGGPMVTPHILVHQRLEAGQSYQFKVALGLGRFRIRTQNQMTATWLEITAKTKSVAIVASADKINLTCQEQDEEMEGQYLSFQVTNQADYEQRVFVESAQWYADAVNAAQVTSLQHFRDLFSDEVLRPGDEIGVAGMTILFSDLVGSTAMYNRWGDAPSYAVVREQFAFLQGVVRRFDGAIVKTIGDAIMAAFYDPAQAVGAALAIQKEIEAFNQSQPDKPLSIKLGLHQGPCIAVTLNGRLDYFGTTVNLAARLEGQSQGGDVVISERIRVDPAVNELIAQQPLQLTQLETDIKGFDEPITMYRLMLSP